MSLSDMAAWMGALPDARKLNEISMPGSHDAGVYREVSNKAGVLPVPKDQTACQDRPVLEQCEAGSRFLDVRLKVSRTSIRAHHTTAGQGAVGESWDSTLESVWTKYRLVPSPSRASSISTVDEPGGVRSSFSQPQVKTSRCGASSSTNSPRAVCPGMTSQR